MGKNNKTIIGIVAAVVIVGGIIGGIIWANSGDDDKKDLKTN